MEVLGQILDLDGSQGGSDVLADDDDDERDVEFGPDEMLHYVDHADVDFSKTLVWNYFAQAEVTLEQMNTALLGLDFALVSTLSHYFKGSSAALGILKVTTTCGEINLCSKLENLNLNQEGAQGKACSQLRDLLASVAVQYLEASVWLKDHYQRKDDIANTARDNFRDLVSIGQDLVIGPATLMRADVPA